MTGSLDPLVQARRANEPSPRRLDDDRRVRPLALVGAIALLLGLFGLPSAFGPSAPVAGVPDPGTHLIGAAPLASAGGVGGSGSAVLPLVAGPAWTNLSTTGAPPARLVLADDPSDGYVLGYAFTASAVPEGYTWTLSNGVWTNITSTAGSPPLWTSPDRPFAMSYDPVDGYVLAVGGTGGTWAFQGGSWAKLSPACYGVNGVLLSLCPAWGAAGGPPFSQSVMLAADPVDGYVLLLGYSGYSLGSYWSWETWKYASDQWTLQCPHSTTSTSGCYSWGTNAPAPRSFSSMASAGASGILLFGGYTNTALNDTWTYLGGTWTPVASPSAPGARFSDALAFDPAVNGTILYGGESLTPAATIAVDNDTWEFAAGAWSNVSSGPAPTPGGTTPVLAGVAYDPVDDEVVLAESLGTNLATGPYTWMWGSTPPIVGLSARASPVEADAGTVVTFDSGFRGGTPPVTLQWSFGDGTTGRGSTVTHAYASSGNYTVGLVASDAANHSASTNLTISVVPSVNTRPSALPDPTDAGLPTTFDPGIMGGTSNRTFAWSFGDGATSSSMSPVHTYAAAGNYPVTVWANDTGGGSSRSSFPETVDPALAVSVSASPSSPSLGEIVNFSAKASGGTPGYTYAWAFGDGGTGGNLKNISHIFTTNGPFSADVRVTDLVGGTVTGSINLTVALNLSVEGSWRLGATPLPVAFSSRVSGGMPGYSYAWSFGDGGTSTAPAPSHTYNASGAYEAILVVTDAAGKQAQASWPVEAAPGGGPLAATLSLNPSHIELSGTANVSASVSGGDGGYTVSWAVPGATCQSAGLLAELCGAPVAGVYPVHFAIVDADGHATVAIANLTVGKLPSLPVRTSNSTGIPSYLYWGAGIAVAAVLVAVIAIARNRSGPPPPPTDELYRKYREGARAAAPRRPVKAPPPDPPEASSPEGEPADPLAHLF
jgi:PKD repeat protein